MNQLRYTTFDEIIKSVVNEEELDARSTARLIQIAVDGYYQIYTTAVQDMKTVELTFDNADLRLINYPVDYEYYSKVGMAIQTCHGTRRLVTLSLNRRLVAPSDAEILEAQSDCECTGTANGDTDLVCNGHNPWGDMYLFRNLIRGGQVVGEVYGMGGGESYAGCFNYDDYEHRFIFSNEIASDAIILLEYKPNPTMARGNTQIPRKCKEAVKAWTKWRMLSRRNSTLGERNEARELYLAAFEALSDYDDSSTGSELRDFVYEHASFIKY